MNAVMLDSEQDGLISVVTRELPAPGPGEALVRVNAASVNFGDHGYLRPGQNIRKVGGFDAAGVVEVAAADGSGPAVGTRVAFMTPHGTWAPLTRVAGTDLAVIPDGVSDVVAAGVPAAGATALGALEASGSVLGRSVLILGASGGVGVLATRLAVLSGARVRVVVRAQGTTPVLPSGVETVTDTEPWDFSSDVVLDMVGGTLLERALATLAPHARVLSVGNASHEASRIDFERIRRRARNASFTAYVREDTSAPDIRRLLELLESGALELPAPRVVSWNDALAGPSVLLRRAHDGGKTVLLFGSET